MLLPQIQPMGPMRRWYDQDPGCARLLLLLDKMSQPDLRQAAIRLLANFTEKVLAKMTDTGKYALHSIGLPALREKYMTRRFMRRAYDHQDDLREIYGLLYRLPTPGLAALGFNLSDAFELLTIYSYACEQLFAEPDPEEVLNLVQRSLHDGLGVGRDTLIEYIGKNMFSDAAAKVQQA
ncbi:MAG: hypothetical protein IPK79_01720 [Vampirovibrionales bacterium]|nr:hypothetical protein [Vampirovibrionales bacterium]